MDGIEVADLKTISQSNVIKQSTSTRIGIWGFKDGKNNNTKWNEMNPGDVAVFIKFENKGCSKIIGFGTIVDKEIDDKIADGIWGSENGETWQRIFYIDNIVLPDNLILRHDALLRKDGIPYSDEHLQGSVIYLPGTSNYETLADLIDSEKEELTTIVITGEGEGKRKQYYTTRYERSRKNREDAIRIHGTVCMACSFNFEKTYGDIGKGFIEVHHIKPLSSRDEEIVVNPETDLVCVCSNCHRMIHHIPGKVLTVEELRNIIQHD